MLVKSFDSSITDLSYNLYKYTQHKQVWKLFEMSCVHQHYVIALYRLDRNKMLLEIFAYPSNNRAFYIAELDL